MLPDFSPAPVYNIVAIVVMDSSITSFLAVFPHDDVYELETITKNILMLEILRNCEYLHQLQITVPLQSQNNRLVTRKDCPYQLNRR